MFDQLGVGMRIKMILDPHEATIKGIAENARYSLQT
jgi:hypothetical protein